MVYAHLIEIDNNSDELLHFGIKGMKWGIRRHFNHKSSSNIEKSSDYKKYESLKSKPVSSLSNAELKTLNDRMQMELTNSQLVDKKSSLGKKLSKKVLFSVGNAALNQVSTLAVQTGISYLKSHQKKS